MGQQFLQNTSKTTDRVVLIMERQVQRVNLKTIKS